jgi:hypothetical protein
MSTFPVIPKQKGVSLIFQNLQQFVVMIASFRASNINTSSPFIQIDNYIIQIGTL